MEELAAQVASLTAQVAALTGRVTVLEDQAASTSNRL